MQKPFDPDRRELVKAGLAGAAVLAVSPSRALAAPAESSITAEEILKRYGGEFGPAKGGE